MRATAAIALLLVAFCAIGCLAINDPVLLKKISDNNQVFMNYIKTGNAAGIGALYTPDAKLLPPGSPTVEGPANIASFFGGAMASGVKGAVFDIVEVGYIHTDELAYERSNYTFLDGNGQAIDNGKYVVLWKNVTGNLFLYTDIFNSNNH